jgi:hypothetical protein
LGIARDHPEEARKFLLLPEESSTGNGDFNFKLHSERPFADVADGAIPGGFVDVTPPLPVNRCWAASHNFLGRQVKVHLWPQVEIL